MEVLSELFDGYAKLTKVESLCLWEIILSLKSFMYQPYQYAQAQE